jgi:hypothetical protein
VSGRALAVCGRSWRRHSRAVARWGHLHAAGEVNDAQASPLTTPLPSRHLMCCLFLYFTSFPTPPFFVTVSCSLHVIIYALTCGLHLCQPTHLSMRASIHSLGGHLSVCQWLFEAGCKDEVYTQNAHGNNPLHFACRQGQLEVHYSRVVNVMYGRVR